MIKVFLLTKLCLESEKLFLTKAKIQRLVQNGLFWGDTISDKNSVRSLTFTLDFASVVYGCALTYSE